MILVTGGLGFIGIHATQALLDLGESCVITEYPGASGPDYTKYLQDQLGKRVFVEPLEVADQAAFLAIGKRYKITGIIHLAVTPEAALPLFEDLRVNVQGLLNALQAGQEWGVSRLTAASSSAVYLDVPDPVLREDISLPMSGRYTYGTVKQIGELLTNTVARRTGLAAINVRFAPVWGPLYHSMAQATGRLVHAAVRGEPPDSSNGPPPFEDDGFDSCYVKDTARGIALLQVAEKLNHGTYNIGSGRITKMKDFVAAINDVIPNAALELRAGRNPRVARDTQLDISRIQSDTGYQPQYNTERGVHEYIDWLKAGNDF